MSQVQLFLPFCAIVVSHFVLGETIDAATIAGAILVTATVFGGRVSLARRARGQDTGSLNGRSRLGLPDEALAKSGEAL